jgi:epimerase transport system membrane fusion protein
MYKLNENNQRYIRFGLGIVVFVFFILGGFAAFIPLSSAVVGVGSVSADFEKKTVQHLEGGVVEAILVHEGDHVKQGDTLVVLRNISAEEQRHILQNQYHEALALQARLQAQLDQANDIEFPQELVSQGADLAVASILQAQRHIFELKRTMLSNDALITRERVVQLSKYIEGIKALIASKTTRLKVIDEEMKEWEALLAEQLIDKIKLRELKKEKISLEGELANAHADIAKTNEQINELNSQLLGHQKEFQDKTLDELVSAKKAVTEARSKIIANDDILQRLNIKAPIDGTIVGLSIRTVGGVIAPGKSLLDIVPDHMPVQILARIQPQDVDQVHANLSADIRFSAFNTRFTHVIEGKILHVSADSIEDARTGSPYYEVKLDLTPKGEAQLKAYGFTLMAGMPVEVMIKTQERTLLSYLIKPLSDMLSRSFNEE